jgi:hypothetical protein
MRCSETTNTYGGNKNMHSKFQSKNSRHHLGDLGINKWIQKWIRKIECQIGDWIQLALNEAIINTVINLQEIS